MKNLELINGYELFLGEVARVLAEGKERARRAVEREKAQAYWEAGRLLHEHVLAYRDRAGYGEQVMFRLARSGRFLNRALVEAGLARKV